MRTKYVADDEVKDVAAMGGSILIITICRGWLLSASVFRGVVVVHGCRDDLVRSIVPTRPVKGWLDEENVASDV